MATRTALHRAGAVVLGQLLSSPETASPTTPCACGHPACYHNTRPKQPTTAVGRVAFDRAYYRCPRCHQDTARVTANSTSRPRRLAGSPPDDGAGRQRNLLSRSRERLHLLAGLEMKRRSMRGARVFWKSTQLARAMLLKGGDSENQKPSRL